MDAFRMSLIFWHGLLKVPIMTIDHNHGIELSYIEDKDQIPYNGDRDRKLPENSSRGSIRSTDLCRGGTCSSDSTYWIICGSTK